LASFVEQATLLLTDKSSANIKKVNAELKTLLATAKQLNNLKINIHGLSQLSKDINKATAALKNIHKQTATLSKPIRPTISLQGVQKVQQLINSLIRPRRLGITAGMGGGGGGGGIGLGGGGTGGSGRQAATGLVGFAKALTRTTRQLLLFQIATNTAMTAIASAGEGVVESEDAETRIRQAGFGVGDTARFEQMSRDIQETYNQIPAAQTLDASVEMLSTMRANGASAQEMQDAMAVVARNAQIMGVTFKDINKGAESARQLAKISEIFNLTGPGEQDQAKRLQNEVMRAIIAEGSDLTVEESVRVARQLGSSITLGLAEGAFADILAARDSGGARSTAEVRTAVRDLTRTSLEKKLKKQQAAVGLREKDAQGNLVLREDYRQQLAANPTQFAFDVLKPKLIELGAVVDPLTGDLAEISQVAALLTEKMGFSTTGMQYFADALTSQSQIIKDRQTREAVDLDAAINANKLRGSFNELVASFQTMAATIAEGVTPYLVSAMKGLSDFLKEFGDIFKTPVVTPEDIAKRRMDIPMPGALGTAVPNALLGTRTEKTANRQATKAEKTTAMRELQKAIGATADGIAGPETTGKFFAAWDKATRELPNKLDSATQYVKDAWQAAGENVMAQNAAFTDKLGKAWDWLAAKIETAFNDFMKSDLSKKGTAKVQEYLLTAVSWIGDQLQEAGIAFAKALWKDFKKKSYLKEGGPADMVRDWFNDTFYKKVSTPDGVKYTDQLRPLSDFLPDEVNNAVTAIKTFSTWIADVAKKGAMDAWTNLLGGIGLVTDGFRMVTGAVNDAVAAVKAFAASLTNFLAEDPRNPPNTPPGTTVPPDQMTPPSELSLLDALRAAIHEALKPTTTTLPPEIAPVPQAATPEAPQQGWLDAIKSWFTDQPPPVDESGKIVGQLSPIVDRAIDGIAQGGTAAADAITVAGGTLPGKGSEMATNFNSGINASAIGNAIGSAAAVKISSAVANLNITVAGGGGKPDTGAVGAPALAA